MGEEPLPSEVPLLPEVKEHSGVRSSMHGVPDVTWTPEAPSAINGPRCMRAICLQCLIVHQSGGIKAATFKIVGDGMLPWWPNLRLGTSRAAVVLHRLDVF